MAESATPASLNAELASSSAPATQPSAPDSDSSALLVSTAAPKPDEALSPAELPLAQPEEVGEATPLLPPTDAPPDFPEDDDAAWQAPSEAAEEDALPNSADGRPADDGAGAKGRTPGQPRGGLEGPPTPGAEEPRYGAKVSTDFSERPETSLEGGPDQSSVALGAAILSLNDSKETTTSAFALEDATGQSLPDGLDPSGSSQGSGGTGS